jgi:hypothetical protein
MTHLLLRLALPASLLLAGCSGRAIPDLSGAHGTTAQAVRGEAPGAPPLRPESGNIWSEGLTPSARP